MTGCHTSLQATRRSAARARALIAQAAKAAMAAAKAASPAQKMASGASSARRDNGGQRAQAPAAAKTPAAQSAHTWPR
jgi:type IV secretory pathway TrbL component